MSTDLKNKWFSMGQKNDGTATIYLYDEIGGWGVTSNDFLRELNSLGDVNTINLHINSGGGSVVEGTAIYNLLKNHKARVITHVDSLAASMASVIAMAGDEIRMAENAMLMIHNPWTISMGEADQLRKDADLLDTMKRSILSAYRKSGKDDEELSNLMSATTWYTAAEAFEAGFIDVIDGANLAAASIGDFETVKEYGYDIPQAKIDKVTIDVLRKSNAEFKAQILDFDARLEEVKIEAAEEKEAALAELSKQHDASFVAYKEVAKAELEKAKEITQAAISDRAAGMLAESGVPAIENEPDTEGVDAGLSIVDKYNAMTPGSDERLEFFKKYKTQILKSLT